MLDGTVMLYMERREEQDGFGEARERRRKKRYMTLDGTKDGSKRWISCKRTMGGGRGGGAPCRREANLAGCAVRDAPDGKQGEMEKKRGNRQENMR